MSLAVDPRFHDLRAEIDKLGALSAAPVDWRRVESLGVALARDQPPDLNVAVYTALARRAVHGLAGLCDALSDLASLLTAPPPDLTPARPKHRAHAVEWLLAHLRPELCALVPAAADAPAHATLAAAVRALRGAARQALGDLTPSFSALVQAADALSAGSAALVPEPAPSHLSPAPSSSALPYDLSSGPSSPHTLDLSSGPHSPPPHDPSPGPASPPPPSAAHGPPAPPRRDLSSAPSSSPPTLAPVDPSIRPPSPPPAPLDLSSGPSSSPQLPAPPPDPAGLDAFLAAAGDALESAARSLRAHAPLDARAIRVLRAGLWLHVNALPTTRADGTTAIPGLSARDRERLDALAAHGRWADLLARSESLLGAHRLALDLQRHSAAALAALGPPAAPALRALRAELHALLTRLPELPRLRDRDGQPLADPLTERWLAAEILASPGAPTPDDGDFWAGLAAQLAGPTRDGALAEARDTIAASPSEHVRSRRRLALAEACERAGEPVAAACFAALADDLRALTVERYDPELAARCLAGVARTRAHPRALDDLLVRLARLDPAAAAAALRAAPAA